MLPYPVEDPNHGSATLETNPWTRNGNPAAYTLKWHTDNERTYDSTRGNNVYAYEDLDGNNLPGYVPKSPTKSPDLTFNFPINYGLDPVENIFNQSFGITNLFYWDNLIHDLTYNYGFDEVAGNAQAYNLGRGGKENDYVIAEAQDGSGTNNANFAPAPDGQKQWQQMFLMGSCLIQIHCI